MSHYCARSPKSGQRVPMATPGYERARDLSSAQVNAQRFHTYPGAPEHKRGGAFRQTACCRASTVVRRAKKTDGTDTILGSKGPKGAKPKKHNRVFRGEKIILSQINVKLDKVMETKAQHHRAKVITKVQALNAIRRARGV
jgi:hypothetical protein